MAQIRGKQILLSSINLDRLNLNNYTVGDTIAGVSPDKVLINKEYADTLAAGWDVKAASRYSTVSNIIGILTANEATIINSLDNIASPGIVELDINDRILVKDQNLTFENGIYVWNGAFLTRSADFDGTPDQEVSQGAYTFVVEGLLNSGYGYMVINRGTLTGENIEVGVDPIIWSKVSKAIAYIDGDGIDIIDNEINIIIETNSGLTFSGSNKLNFSLTDYFTNHGVTELGSSLDWSGTLLDLDYVTVATNLAGSGLSVGTDGTLNVDPIAVPVEYKIYFNANAATASPSIVEMENFAIATSTVDWTTLIGSTELDLNGINYQVGATAPFWYSDTIVGVKQNVPTTVYNKLYVDINLLEFDIEEGFEPDTIKIAYHLGEVL